jgi:DNA-directed RNA polymerase specialized sigma subunit
MNREDLKQYKYSQRWIKEQLNRYEEQRSMVYKLSQNIDGMPKAQNKPNYTLEDLMDQYDYILELLNKEQEKQNKILGQIMQVEEPYRTILTCKYIDNKSLEEISTIIHYAYDRTCKMHGRALNLFDEIGNGQ